MWLAVSLSSKWFLGILFLSTKLLLGADLNKIRRHHTLWYARGETFFRSFVRKLPTVAVWEICRTRRYSTYLGNKKVVLITLTAPNTFSGFSNRLLGFVLAPFCKQCWEYLHSRASAHGALEKSEREVTFYKNFRASKRSEQRTTCGQEKHGCHFNSAKTVH